MNLKPSIFGENEVHIPSGCEDLGHFIGLNNVTILQGDPFDPTEVGKGEEFDPMDGVTAVDGNGNTVTVTVVLEP